MSEENQEKLSEAQHAFDLYISDTFNRLRQAHLKASHSFLKEIGPQNFISNSANKKGILLIHGLLDTCSTMGSLFDSFVEKSYSVKTILLPGHGTTPNDMLSVKYQDWLDCAQMAMNAMNEQVDDLTIIGLSAGATIACQLAQTSDKVSRLVLFAPAFALSHSTAVLIPLIQKFNDYMPYLAKQWLVYEDQPVTDPVKYRSITTNSVFQLLSMANSLIQNLASSPIKCPILTFLSSEDETISTPKAIEVLTQQPNPQNQIILYSNQAQCCDDTNIEVLSSCFPDERILNFSHICMHQSPNHPRYGKSAQVADHYLGALTAQNELNYAGRLSRLTFTPYYDTQFEQIIKFIEN